jgi:hypothetical protein
MKMETILASVFAVVAIGSFCTVVYINTPSAKDLAATGFTQAKDDCSNKKDKEAKKKGCGYLAADERQRMGK